MVHKILLFNVADEAKAALIKEKAYELLNQVPGAHNVTFRPAIHEGTVKYQYLLTVDFDSMETHEAYMVHDKHMEFATQYFRPNISDVLIQFFQDEVARG